MQPMPTVPVDYYGQGYEVSDDVELIESTQPDMEIDPSTDEWELPVFSVEDTLFFHRTSGLRKSHLARLEDVDAGENVLFIRAGD